LIKEAVQVKANTLSPHSILMKLKKWWFFVLNSLVV